MDWMIPGGLICLFPLYALFLLASLESVKPFLGLTMQSRDENGSISYNTTG